MYNYYKIEEQHVEEVSKFLSEKEIPFTNLSSPVKYVCEEVLDKFIEEQNEDLKPIFRKVENTIVDYMADGYNHYMIDAGHTNLIMNAIEKLNNTSMESGE